MNRDDTRMVEAGEYSCFREEGLDTLGGWGPLGIGQLDGNLAVQVDVVRKVNPPEPALAKPANDPVTPDANRIRVRGADRARAGAQRTGSCRYAHCLISRCT